MLVRAKVCVAGCVNVIGCLKVSVSEDVYQREWASEDV